MLGKFIVGGMVLIAILELFKSWEKENGKWKFKPVHFCIAVASILLVYLNFNRDEASKTEQVIEKRSLDSLWKAQLLKSDSIITLLRTDTASAGELLRKCGIKDLSAGRAFVSFPTGLMSLSGESYDSMDLKVYLVNSGPSIALNLQYNIHYIQKSSDVMHRPEAIYNNWEDRLNLALNAGQFSRRGILVKNGTPDNNDTIFIRAKYKWDNPAKGISTPVYRYAYWNVKSGFADASRFSIATISEAFRRAGIE